MSSEDPRFQRGIERFNRGEFFEAHEAWEEWWHDTQGNDRDFIQGLIQVTSALHHMRSGNMRGARILHGSAGELLGPYGPRHRGLDLQKLRREFDRALEGILDVPLDQLASRGYPGLLRIPFTPERSFLLAIEENSDAS